MRDSYHPLREELMAELHARPFPVIDAPCQIAYLAVANGAGGNPLDRLIASLDFPKCDSDTHYYEVQKGLALKWERHTEFESFAIFNLNPSGAIFAPQQEGHFPQSWLASLGPTILTAAKLHIISPMALKESALFVQKDFPNDFNKESLAISYVLDKSAVVASDFFTDEEGFVRFGVVPIGQVGRHRLGRIAQRLLEIETYRAMAMLTVPIAKTLFSRLTDLEKRLAAAVDNISARDAILREDLDEIMRISAEIESLSAAHSFRFGAAEAYAALVHHRIDVLIEERFMGRQTFAEFMMRRFLPSVRTCDAASKRLADISDRAARAAELLGTRVNLRTNHQNQTLLEQMDRRAELQLRLQETVEGLSVVAISYYAVNLLSYLAAPLAAGLDLSKTYLTAMLVLPVFLLVYGGILRFRKKLEPHQSEQDGR